MKEKFKIKDWFKERFSKAKDFCVTHPDAMLSIIGGVLSLVAAGLDIYGNRVEYKDNVYTSIDDKIYKIPCKEMKTCNKVRKDE